MGIDFTDDSRQDEKVNIEKFDRHTSGPYNLSDNRLNFYIIPFKEGSLGDDFRGSQEALRPEIGNYQLVQY